MMTAIERKGRASERGTQDRKAGAYKQTFSYRERRNIANWSATGSRQSTNPSPVLDDDDEEEDNEYDVDDALIRDRQSSYRAR